MAAGLLVMAALVFGLAPAGLPLGDDPLQPGLAADPVSLDASEGVAAATDLPLPVAVETTLPALPVCGGCLPLRVAVGPGATATPAAPASSSKPGEGPLAIVRDAPPEAVAAGSSVLATGLAIAAWLARSGLGLFSRIEDGELALHPLRRQALDYIAANPGATLQDVRRALGVAWGTAVYHLGRLERAGQVAVRHIGGHRSHWPLGQAPQPGSLAATGQALARLVRDTPGLSQNELARRAGIGPPAACKQLRRLESAGFVEGRRAGRARHYVATPRLDLVLAPV